MNKRAPPLPLDAVVRAVAELGIDDSEASAAVLAAALRIAGVRERGPSQPSDQGQGQAEMPGPRVRPARTPHRRPRRQPPRVVRLFELPKVEPRGVGSDLGSGKILPLERGEEKRGAALDANALTPRSTARGVIKALLSTPSAAGGIDLQAVLQMLVQARPIERLPRRPALGLGRGATLLLDVGAWIDPFRSDVAALVESLQAVVGRDHLLVRETMNGPPVDLPGSKADDGSSFRPLSNAPVLIVSDFGLSRGEGLPPRAGASAWRQFAATLRASGREPIGLLPFAAADWPSTLSREVALVHWAPEATGRSVRRARERQGGGTGRDRPVSNGSPSADMEKLIAAAAVCSRVEPRFLRNLRLRLSPRSSAGLESHLWWSSEVGSRGAAAVTFTQDALTRLRASLRQQPELAGIALDCRGRTGLPAPAVLRFAEEIVEIDILRASGWQRLIARKLSDLRRTLLERLDEPDRTALEAARYVLAALPPLIVPPAARQCKADLLFLASRLLGGTPAARSPHGGASKWLVQRLAEPGTPHSRVGVRWDEEGLTFTPNVEDGDTIRTPGSPPTISAVWSPPRHASEWLRLSRTHRLHPPNTDYLEVRSLSGERWGVEDADAADSLPPLRVFALIHPDDRNARAERFLDRLEASLRAYSGHPPAASLLVRRFGTERWDSLSPEGQRRLVTGSIGTWRSPTATAVAESTAFIIVVTPNLITENWSHETLGDIANSHRLDPPVIAIDWTDDDRRAAQLLEKGGLGKVPLRRSRASDAAEAEAVAKQLARAWRAKKMDAPAILRSPELEMRQPAWVGSGLQGMSLAFHVRAFDRDVGSWWGDELDRALWKLHSAPTLQLNPGDGHESALAMAEADLRFVVFLSEYVYAGPVSHYLAGYDPFRPAFSVTEIAGAWAGEEGDYEPGKPRLPAFDAAVKILERFGADADKERFYSLLGEARELPPDQLGRALGSDTLLEVVRVLHPYVTAWNELRLRHEFSFAGSRTFPEFMESFAGLFLHYVRSLAENRPETRVRLTYPAWADAREEVGRIYPAAFGHRTSRGGFADEAEGESGDTMPIEAFADLFAGLSGLLAAQLRSRAAEYRHSFGAR